MARSVTIDSVKRQNGKVYIRFGKSELEIPAASVAEFREWVREQFDETDEFIVKFALAMLLARDPNLTNPGIIVGKTITLNLQGSVNGTNPVVKVS